VVSKKVKNKLFVKLNERYRYYFRYMIFGLSQGLISNEEYAMFRDNFSKCYAKQIEDMHSKYTSGLSKIIKKFA